MQLLADRLRLSPSDVTAYLACEHLTTLSLRAARGEVEAPVFEDEQRRAQVDQATKEGAVARSLGRANGKAIAFARGAKRSRHEGSDRERRIGIEPKVDDSSTIAPVFGTFRRSTRPALGACF